MIAYIIGTVSALLKDSLILECGGIGYQIYVPSSLINQTTIGDEIRVHTYLAIREDAITLYGFKTKDDLSLFKLLIGVSGIGPKGAVSVLSTLDADDLRFAVLSDDVETITKIPGIGRKTAQKLILDLKDKLDLEDAFEKKAAGNNGGTIPAEGSPQSDAVMAMVALGYPSTEALRAVKKAAAEDDTLDTEALLKKALKEL